MSDCSTQAMMPKERRTCKHCEPSEWHCDSKASEYSWMVDVDDVNLPCGGYGYERRIDGLAERNERTWTEPFEAYMPNGERVASFAGYSLEEAYSILVCHERLAQVAREMLETIRGYVSENLRGADPRLRDSICEPYVNYRGKLEGCGVIVDD